MNTAKLKWMAALPYLLVLMVVVNVHFLGMREFYLYGINLSLTSIVPYLACALILFRAEDRFVRHHAHASFGIFFTYFVLSSLYGFMMYVLGYRVGVIDLEALIAANSTTWLAVGTLLVILLYTVVSAVQGMLCTFQLRHPGGQPYGG